MTFNLSIQDGCTYTISLKLKYVVTLLFHDADINCMYMLMLSLCTAQPTFVTPDMVRATEGDISTPIICKATGVPVPLISWTGPRSIIKNDREYFNITNTNPVLVLDGVKEVFQVTSELTIMNVRREDAGVCSCNVPGGFICNVGSNTTLNVMCKCISIVVRHEAIMLQKLSIMLLNSTQKITYYAFENCPLFSKLCHHNWLIMPVYYCIRPFSLMFNFK